MQVYFAMALCMWREDWAPHSGAVQIAIHEFHNRLVDFTKPFHCRHPLQGPEELRCYTAINITHSQCMNYKSEVKDLPSGTITIKSNDASAEPFSLCRLDLNCNAPMKKYIVIDD